MSFTIAIDPALEIDEAEPLGRGTMFIDVATETDEAPPITLFTYARPTGGLTFDVDFGGSTYTPPAGGSTGSLTNTGIAPVYPVCVVSGQIDEPVLTNVTTSESVRFLVNLGAADTLVVDMKARTALINGVPGAYAAVDPNMAHWWALAPGSNSVTLQGTNVGSTTLTVNFRSASL